MTNTLYFGDNLDILRRHVADESVDLIYLDPPFNSNRSYNVLFKESSGHESDAQIEAFGDSWHWNDAAAATLADLPDHAPHKAVEMIQALVHALGHNDVAAYLVMMTARLVELHRVLKPTGSLYLHCDPTASHYLKVVMDAIFGPRFYRNEIVWKRTSARSDSHRWNHIHDTLFFYTKSDNYTWHTQFTEYDAAYVDKFYHFVEPVTERRYASDNLTADGTRAGSSGDCWGGIDVRAKGLHWKYTTDKLDELDREGRIIWPKKPGGVPRYKRYLDEMHGLAIQSIVTDIPPLSAQSAEKLGYPTQKPLALLERIIQASSNPGDVVLDPFCGCGTAIAASQKLGRQWVGIDITHLAIALIKNRLKDMFGESCTYQVIGEPTCQADAEQLAAENPYQFQWWAISLVGARPAEQKKGADKGVDGRLYFRDEADGGPAKQVILSVKAGHITSGHVRDLRGVVDREGAQIGVLITLHKPTSAMVTEAASAGVYESPGWGRKHPRLQIITVGELLDGRAIDMPPIRQVNVTHKRAPKVEGEAPDQGRLAL